VGAKFLTIARYLKMSKPEYFESACVLFEVPEALSKMVCQLANDIDQDLIDFDNGGIEANAHITVLFGVKDTLDLKKYFVKPLNILSDQTVTYFDNDKFSVAKIKVFSEELKALHYQMKDNEYNEHSYDYNPHITIAYLKKGKRLNIPKFSAYKWQQNEIELTRNGLIDKVAI